MKKIIKRFISLLPVKKRIILESHPDFSGNTYQVFEQMLQYKLNDTHEITWLVENPGKFSHINIKNVTFRKYYTNTKKEKLSLFLYKASAQVLVFENKLIGKANSKTKSIFLNHGTLLKNTKGLYAPEKSVDYVISASENINHIYEYAYDISSDIIKPLGYPRNDLLFEDKKVDWGQFFDDFQGEKIIIWMPTFRQHNSGQRNDTENSSQKLPLGIPILYNEEMLKDMNDYLKKHNVFLVLKAHYAQNLEFIKVNNLSHFKILSDQQLLDKGTSLYEALPSTDALITDYSSIYFDYLLLNKPIGLTNDDIDDYKIGFMYENIDEVLVGETITDCKMLRHFVSNVANDLDVHRELRQKVNDYFNKYQDGESAKRVFELVKQTLRI
ncbi:MAG: CDP-glycerol glycerophosphotransferase family protein [Solibacillus sp.]